jgi:photosystem II stability/assembly factor-like uncharacterized protein
LPKKNKLPPIALPSPILSLASDGKGGVWAGGIGGVAHFAPDSGWTPYISGLPLSGVSALTTTGDWLFAGGIEGLSRSETTKIEWQLSRIEGKGNSIAAIAVSPDFAEDKSALAATLGGGILRTEDAGVTWRNANFGLLNFEITALVWIGEQVIAATANGIYRSPNGGRAWRVVDETLGTAFAALVTFNDENLLAATDDGLLLYSADNGSSWVRWLNNLPDGLVITSLERSEKDLLLGTGNMGLWRSSDAGHKWKRVAEMPIFCIEACGKTFYAGTATGLIGSRDSGKTWEQLPLSPLHDLRRIQVLNGQVIVSGGFSVTLRYDKKQWRVMEQVPLPLSLLTHNRQGRLFASGADGLFISDDDGSQWQQVLSSSQGHLGHMTLRENGQGWAFNVDSSRILRTSDAGLKWEIAASPLGADTVVALESTPDLVFAATYNPLQQTARLWYSKDDGNKWQRGAEARTAWAIVATYRNPPMVSLGGTILAQQADETWQAAQMPAAAGLAVRRISGINDLILVLTTRGMLISHDQAQTFAWLEGIDLPVEQMMDFALDDSQIYILSVGGQVTSFNLPK